mmetsp:Transcript_8927/g.18540  ORF Transcript_8927/g.18540 Transcript_8927/m.18540 type:complete len:223 (+) Transcript_8927:229-897(+)
MAKFIFMRLAPINASLQALRGPATMIMCCLAPFCKSETLAVREFPSAPMVISNGRVCKMDSRPFMAWLTFFCSFLRWILSSTLPWSSACLSKSYFAQTPMRITTPKSIPMFNNSVCRLNSGLFMAAIAPEPLIRPPIKAPDPKDPYTNKRSVLQGAIDSVTNLLRMDSSRPPFFFFSAKRVVNESCESNDCCSSMRRGLTARDLDAGTKADAPPMTVRKRSR